MPITKKREEEFRGQAELLRGRSKKENRIKETVKSMRMMELLLERKKFQPHTSKRLYGPLMSETGSQNIGQGNY